MKKILFSVLSLLTLLMVTSCSNDEIKIELGGHKYNVTYNIATSNMYDTFGLTSDIRDNYLREQSLCVGVTSFLYDANGNIIDKKFSSQYTFNTVTQEFSNLVEGKYTIVTVETLVDPEDEYKAEDWTFEGEDKLSTLRIKQESHYAYRTSVLGTCSANVNLTADATLNGTPQAIGSLVEFHPDNFEKTTHAYVGFATNDVIEAYKLDPSLSRESRYVQDLTTSGYINVRGFLSAEDSENYFLTLYLLESSIDWRFCFVKAENADKNTWTTYNANTGTAKLQDGVKYYGGFWYKNENSVPECYFGDATGYASWRNALKDAASATVSVTPPYMTWGASVTNVSSSMSGYSQKTGTSSRAVLQDDGSYLIEYTGKGSESMIAYYFTTATTGLFESDLFFDKTKVGEDALLNYANSNYTFLVESNGSYMFQTKDSKTYVILMESGNYWVLGYVDKNYLSSSSAKYIFGDTPAAIRKSDGLFEASAPRFTANGEKTQRMIKAVK